jgi:outer membrane immunogenic protein
MRKCLGIAGAFAAAISLGAMDAATAADMPTKAPIYKAPAAVQYDWTGFYAGLQGGGAWGTVPNSFTIAGITTSQPSYKTSGGLIGAHAGYNWQTGSFVYGLVTDIEWANIKGDDGGLSGVTDKLENNWRGSLRGRVGMAWDRLLVYATGGLAFGNLKYSLNAVAPASGSTGASATDAGWTLGGGAEYAFLPAWSAFVEYRYTDFGSHTPAFAATTFSVAQTVDYSYRDNAVRGGISYHFGK